MKTFKKLLQKFRIRKLQFCMWHGICIRKYGPLRMIFFSEFYDRPLVGKGLFKGIPCSFNEDGEELDGIYYHYYYVTTIFGRRYRFTYWIFDIKKQEHSEEYDENITKLN